MGTPTFFTPTVLTPAFLGAAPAFLTAVFLTAAFLAAAFRAAALRMAVFLTAAVGRRLAGAFADLDGGLLRRARRLGVAYVARRPAGVFLMRRAEAFALAARPAARTAARRRA
jgi:hypothetical protein